MKNFISCVKKQAQSVKENIVGSHLRERIRERLGRYRHADLAAKTPRTCETSSPTKLESPAPADTALSSNESEGAEGLGIDESVKAQPTLNTSDQAKEQPKAQPVLGEESSSTTRPTAVDNKSHRKAVRFAPIESTSQKLELKTANPEPGPPRLPGTYPKTHAIAVEHKHHHKTVKSAAIRHANREHQLDAATLEPAPSRLPGTCSTIHATPVDHEYYHKAVKSAAIKPASREHELDAAILEPGPSRLPGTYSSVDAVQNHNLCTLVETKLINKITDKDVISTKPVRSIRLQEVIRGQKPLCQCIVEASDGSQSTGYVENVQYAAMAASQPYLQQSEPYLDTAKVSPLAPRSTEFLQALRDRVAADPLIAALCSDFKSTGVAPERSLSPKPWYVEDQIHELIKAPSTGTVIHNPDITRPTASLHSNDQGAPGEKVASDSTSHGTKRYTCIDGSSRLQYVEVDGMLTLGLFLDKKSVDKLIETLDGHLMLTKLQKDVSNMHEGCKSIETSIKRRCKQLHKDPEFRYDLDQQEEYQHLQQDMEWIKARSRALDTILESEKNEQLHKQCCILYSLTQPFAEAGYLAADVESSVSSVSRGSVVRQQPKAHQPNFILGNVASDTYSVDRMIARVELAKLRYQQRHTATMDLLARSEADYCSSGEGFFVQSGRIEEWLAGVGDSQPASANDDDSDMF